MRIGYHSSHEQFSPSELLRHVRHAEDVGFNGIMSSDHFSPWSKRQGESGFAWSWLGAAMQVTSLPFGSLCIPGSFRMHPAVLGQAIATLSELYPGRLPWVAAGSGEPMNECITGAAWPDREQRQERLKAGAEMLRRLWSGEEVSVAHGPLQVDKAKIWSLPQQAPQIYAAVLSENSAEWAGEWADGLITVKKSKDELQKIIEAFQRGGGADKPLALQFQFSWAPSYDEALENAWGQWRHAALDLDLIQTLKTPDEFDAACEKLTKGDLEKAMMIVDDMGPVLKQLQLYKDLGFSEVYVHNAGRNQTQFIEVFGSAVLPVFRDV